VVTFFRLLLINAHYAGKDTQYARVRTDVSAKMIA
jgi:hypothetical protein